MPKESSIQTAVLKYLNGLPECVAENVHGNACTSGRPDVNACYKGHLLRIELKSPDNDNVPSTAQKADLRLWKRSGAIGVVAYSLAEVKYLVNPKYGIACLNKMCRNCPIKPKYCYCKYKETPDE